MKALNKQSTQTMNKMVSMLEEGYIKIDNTGGSFMPVSVEQIFENEKYRIFSVAHYYEQNGDLMADPEMCFINLKAVGSFLPSYFKQDNIGMEQESIIIEDDVIKGYRAKMQADHTSFANMWLRNIKNQQNL
jgi:hypothetical protein